MLALRLVLTEAPGTLVFDEVDAGIGGEAALAVGRSLAALGSRHQVLVVTHLPQVAAFADHQVAVSKDEGGAARGPAPSPSTGDARTRELSRMLSGLADSGAARRHATELLDDGPSRAGRCRWPSMTPRSTEVVGRCRVDRRTKNLVQRLLPGEIAVIDHSDLDRVAAEALIEAGAAAVVNAASSMSGRYPNLGPLLIAAAGIPLIDDVGAQVLDVLVEGEVVAIVGGQVIVAGAVVAHGERQSMASLEDKIEEARRTVGVELERFASNTLEYLKDEHHLVTDSLDLPDVPVSFQGRQALVVSRGDDYRDDLARPEALGLPARGEAGADRRRRRRRRPPRARPHARHHHRRLRLGARGDAALRGHAGRPRLPRRAWRPACCASGPSASSTRSSRPPGTSEDIALLLAFELGAELIVAVGLHSSLEEFLDKGRAGMSSTFLVRLKVGRILVDAKGVSRLYRPVVRRVDAAALVRGHAARAGGGGAREPARCSCGCAACGSCCARPRPMTPGGRRPMINFRYHLVSLVAVFLALAIGIVAGSTVIKESILDQTQQNLDRAEKNLKDLENTNAALRSELDQLNRRDQALDRAGVTDFLQDRLDRPAGHDDEGRRRRRRAPPPRCARPSSPPAPATPAP